MHETADVFEREANLASSALTFPGIQFINKFINSISDL